MGTGEKKHLSNKKHKLLQHFSQHESHNLQHERGVGGWRLFNVWQPGWGRSPQVKSSGPLTRPGVQAGNIQTALTFFVQGPDGSYQWPRYPILPQYPPQDPPRDMIESLLQVHKTHVDWIGKVSRPPQQPCKVTELVLSLSQALLSLPESPNSLPELP